MRRRNALYGSFILLECVLWGLGNPVIKIAGETLPAFASIAMRFTLAFLLYLVFFGRKVFWQLRTVRWLPTLSVCVFTALAFTLGSFALMLTDAVIAGFLMGLAVLFTPFLEPLLLGKRFSLRVLPIILVVCVGMYLLCGGAAFTFGAGELLAILCSLSFAVMLTLSEKYIADMDTVTLSTMQCAVAAVLGIVCMLIFEGVPALDVITPRGLGAVAYLAVGSTFVAYLLQNVAMRHIPATFASLAFCTEPIFTALFSYLLLGERLGWTGLLGAGIILAGVVYASLAKEGKADEPEGADRVSGGAGVSEE